jgi:hypothetical protein
MLRMRAISVLSVAGMAAAALVTAGPSVQAETYSSKPDCAELAICTEVANPQEAFGNYYVGHDEPSTEFYSNVPGSGNRSQYQLTIPTEPAGAFSKSKGYDFELHPAFWFGMALCDTFSYPEQRSTCTPNSDKNIVDPAQSKKGPGVAFMELQFYSPGWVSQFDGFSCDATKWCVALNIDSLSEDPINGTLLNDTCQSQILGGVEYVNFAYLTHDGKPLGPPNPLQFDPSTSGYPKTNGGKDTLFLNPGDKVTVTLKDTPAGFTTIVADNTTGKTGFMTASAANGFGHMKYLPTGTGCQMENYTFHPMYSTSSPQTRVLWAAHTYNVAFSDEIGHFDFCSSIDPSTASCNGLEGIPGDQEAADGDDNACFPAAASLKYPATGCVDTNTPGFDGTPYQNYWPDGQSTHPTPILFSSPRTGEDFQTAYGQFAFEADLPRIEAADLGGNCNRTTGANCLNPPMTDDGTPVPFYPYFSQVATHSGCAWGIGSTLPRTINNFGGNAQYGPLLKSTYWAFGGHGATVQRYNNFSSGALRNTC